VGQRRHVDAVVVLLRGDAEVTSWPLTGCGHPDLAVVDHLARLVLVARRLGCSIRLRDACGKLTELVDLVGLGEVLTPASLLGQVGGKAEGGEQAGVEEVVVRHDPVG
jgi:hypothetical protein